LPGEAEVAGSFAGALPGAATEVELALLAAPFVGAPASGAAAVVGVAGFEAGMVDPPAAGTVDPALTGGGASATAGFAGERSSIGAGTPVDAQPNSAMHATNAAHSPVT